ncbi:MAG: lipopolysaccharide biosynthesis protein [Anaerolineaceae bacterium]|nr:lipopolysaccharide biosynthesis protein [Anaerolineaceae bacterium]
MSTGSENNFSRKVISGSIWTYASVYGGKFLVFITTIILARLLSKSDFGVVGYALVVISFLEVLIGLGVGPALVFFQEEEGAADTAFWLGLAVGIFLYIVSWFIAPFVAIYFRDERVVPIVRLMTLVFLLYPLNFVHESLMIKRLEFRKKFLPGISRSTFKGLTAVILALFGFGYWSLAYAQIVGVFADVITCWKVYKWRPRFRFVKRIAKSLISYGINIVALDTLSMLLLNLDYLFIGRFLGTEALGVYTLGFRIPDLLITQFTSVIERVIFPIYVKMREIPDALENGFKATLKYVSLVVLPMGVGMFLVAEPFVKTFLTEKWIEVIPVTRAIAIYATLFALSRNAGSLYKAIGRPDILTKQASGRLVVLAPALYFVSVKIGTISAVAWTHAAIALVAGTVNLIVAAWIIKIPFLTILNSMRLAVVGTVGMAASVYGISLISTQLFPWLQLTLAVLTGLLVYVGLLILQDRGLISEFKAVFQEMRT